VKGVLHHVKTYPKIAFPTSIRTCENLFTQEKSGMPKQCTLNCFLATLLICISPDCSIKADEVQAGKYKFRVLDGFEVEVVAAPPLVKYPICADFDEQGRMYVCESSGSMDWNKPQPPETPHKVLRLEDTDGDGKFDRKTVFATFEMMAQGSLFLDGSLYVAAAPIIWKLTDTDDDGVVDQREEWVKVDAVTGCLNDLRGPYRGPDGYIYWCKGPSLQEYVIDGKPWKSDARHLLRRHPNGKEVDSLMVGGMDNLIEIAFTLGGQRMVTCTYLQPLGAPRDDGILHAIYGGVYAKDIAPIYNFPWTGPDLMPPMTVWGAMSPAGLMTYQSEFFGPDYRGNLFSALFSGHKVLRHVLKTKGATFECTNEEFLACDQVDFHPTDVLEDADGSLLVIETGGWYRNCCPSSTFYRPDVDGAIYRVKKTGMPVVNDPRGLKLDWAKASEKDRINRLADPRPAVRQRATKTLVDQGEPSIRVFNSVLNSQVAATAKLEAVSGLSRIDSSKERLRALYASLKDGTGEVRQTAANVLSLHRDPSAYDPFVELLKNGDLHDQRLAVEAIGRLRQSSAIPILMERLEQPTDRILEHALIYAMIEIGNAKPLLPFVESQNPNARRAAMIAIDQIDKESLDPNVVLNALSASDQRLQDAAWWIASRNPTRMGSLMAGRLRELLAEDPNNIAQRNHLRTRLSKLIRAPKLSQWVVNELTASGISTKNRMLLLNAMGDAGGQNVDPSWLKAILQTLNDSGRDASVVNEAIATLAKLPPLKSSADPGKKIATQLQETLLATANDEAIATNTRIKALSSMQGGPAKLETNLFSFLVAQLAPEQPLEIRSSAAETLAKAKLTDQQKQALASSLKNLGLSELTILLPVFQGAKDAVIGEKLVQSLLGSTAASSLNAFRLKSLLAEFSETVQQSANPLLDRLEQSQSEQIAKANEVAGLVASADPRRGLQVFSSQKAACTACHKAANIGGITGPHLRGVGQRRSDRDLIESIMFPNASFVQSYDTWKVLTVDGQVMTGVLVEDRPDEIVLSAGLDKTFRIPRSSIEQITRSDQSMMPSGIDKLISNQDLADLIAYLKTL
jgi:putative membrane-bound dehydrogenase-like protein